MVSRKLPTYPQKEQSRKCGGIDVVSNGMTCRFIATLSASIFLAMVTVAGLQGCGTKAGKSRAHSVVGSLADRVIYPDQVGDFRFVRKNLLESSSEAVVLRYVTPDTQMGFVEAVVYPFRPVGMQSFTPEHQAGVFVQHYETVKREVFFSVKGQRYQKVSFDKEDRLKVPGIALPVHRALYTAVNDTESQYAVLYLALLGDYCLRVQAMMPKKSYRQHADHLKDVALQLITGITIPNN